MGTRGYRSHLHRAGLVGLPINLAAQTDASLVELAGVAAAAAILRLTCFKPRLLRLALLAEAADMLTFVLIPSRSWAGERNPIARHVVDWAVAVLPGAGSFPLAAAGIILVAAKFGLALYLVRISPHLGRYRPAVLTVAIAAGLIGLASNLVAFLPA